MERRKCFLDYEEHPGVSKTAFSNKFACSFDSIYGNVVEELSKNGWLVSEGDRVCLTKSGMFIGNDVFEKFLIKLRITKRSSCFRSSCFLELIDNEVD